MQTCLNSYILEGSSNEVTGSALFPKSEMEPLQMQHSSAIFHKQKPVIDVLIVVSFNDFGQWLLV